MPQPKLQTTRDIVLRALPYVRGSVLDVGAGSAKYKSLLEKQAESYVAFDAVAGANVDVVGSVEQLPFPDASFDAALCNQVLEHVAHPQRVVGEICRVLKPKGVCILTAPFVAPFHKDPEDYFRYTVDGLALLVCEAGFDVIEKDCYTPIFSTFFQMFEFTYFNPYAPHKHGGGWADRFLRYALKCAKILDRLFAKRHIVYGNSYVIARKS